MEIIETKIKDLLVIKPDVFTDERGYFFESYNKERFAQHGLDMTFVQDNESQSMKGVLRGLHFQKPPFAQGKLVRVVKGSVMDVAVDLRKGSPTYGQWESVVLTEGNKFMYWIPEGFAHGFVCLEDHSVFTYKCTNVCSLTNAPTSTTKPRKEAYAGTTPTSASTGTSKTRFCPTRTR